MQHVLPRGAGMLNMSVHSNDIQCVVGTVTLPDGREAYVVVSASEVCLPRPSVAPVPFGQ